MKLYIFLFVIVALAGCSNNSSTGSNNNTNGSTIYGGNYFPLIDNTTLTGHVNGTITHLDTGGNIAGTDQVDQDWNVAIGFIKAHNGQNVHPIFVSEVNSHQNNGGNPVGYVGNLDSEIFAMNPYNNSGIATILPQIITVGQTWTPAAAALPIQCQAKAVQQLVQFTAKDGTSYSNVLEVSVSYLDSSYNFNTTIYRASTNLYFANGIGLVEADVLSYEYLHFYGTSITSVNFNHKTGTGSVWKTN